MSSIDDYEDDLGSLKSDDLLEAVDAAEAASSSQPAPSSAPSLGLASTDISTPSRRVLPATQRSPSASRPPAAMRSIESPLTSSIYSPATPNELRTSSQLTSQPASLLNTSSTPPLRPSLSAAPPAAQVDPAEYRLQWGKHKGRLLSEVPLDYVRWLQTSSDAYRTNQTLQSAVQHLLDSLRAASTVPTPQPMSSQQATHPSSQDRKPYVLTFGKYQGQTLEAATPSYVAWLKDSNMYADDADLRAAIAAWESAPRAYVLDFGKYAGYTLDEVPPTYINYLHDSGAAKEHEHLRRELAKHKSRNAAAQASTILGADADPDAAPTTSTKRTNKKAWVIPDEHTGDFRRYYYGGTRDGGQMWIGKHDAVRYFGADPGAMVAAGLHAHHRGQRFWLHQVFSYAKHFGTTKGETPTKALNKFKARKYN